EAKGFLAGAGADGEHANDAADAEDDAEGGEQGAGLLGAEVGDGLADVGEEDHRGAPGRSRVDRRRKTIVCPTGRYALPNGRGSDWGGIVRIIWRGPSWRRRMGLRRF